MPWGDVPTVLKDLIEWYRDWSDTRTAEELDREVKALETTSWIKQEQARLGLATADDVDAVHQQLRELQRRAAAKRARNPVRRGDSS